MLTRNLKESELSLAYLHAVAASVKYAVDTPHIDADSIDATISAKGKITPTSIKHSPRIEVQLKASEKFEVNSDDEIAFSLPLKNYDDLRADTVLPRLLVIYDLHENESEWLVHSSDKLIMQKCAYYLNLKGLPASPNSGHQTVYIPKVNILSPDKLQELMIKASNLEDL